MPQHEDGWRNGDITHQPPFDGEWSASHHYCFTPEETVPGILIVYFSVGLVILLEYY
jgi:hypothetical protein